MSDAVPELSPAQAALLALLVEREALCFGDFVLKSGRRSPYFINLGRLCQGGDLAVLGRAYAETLRAAYGDGIDAIFGPAYKGIPLALAAAAAYQELVGRPVGWAFDRKEAKAHGDGGWLVGQPLSAGQRVAIVDDVLTAGTALREALAKLRPLAVRVVGAVVAIDREEPGSAGRPAREELMAQEDLPVAAIVGIRAACAWLAARPRGGRCALAAEDAARILAHLAAQQA